MLEKLLVGVDCLELLNFKNLEVSTLAFDSRKVEQEGVFVALTGTQVNGHDYIDVALAQGAVVIVCEVLPEVIPAEIVYVKVESSSKALSLMASNYYGNPSKDLKVVGITGTNGKTTIATQLFEVSRSLGFSSGLLSTVKVCIDEHEFPATHTTPDALQINYYMREMVDAGASYCFMEVSSHGIDQNRIEGIDFTGAVFTNLSHDHLDYHKDFKSYRDVKKRLFDGLSKSAFSLVNKDDKNGVFMLQNSNSKKRFYGLKSVSDYHGKVIENGLFGLHLKINNHELYTKMLGLFNAYNLLAIYGVGMELGWSEEDLLRALSLLQGADGRFQCTVSQTGVYVIVDYAHTPDALKNVLETISDFKGNGKVISVFGCGGDRDRSKRPIMARIGVGMSDYAVLTSDNPRTEDPNEILAEMERGVASEDVSKYIVIPDRKQGIKLACQQASSGDVLLIAGKGHETYQEIGKQRFDFDDNLVVSELLTELKK